MPRPRTRDEILRVAAGLFTRDGFKGTSLHDIAAEVGVSKAALLYHFATKDAILTELLEPAMADLATLLDELDALDDRAAQLAAIDGFTDLVLRYRREVGLMYDLIPQYHSGDFFASLRPLADRLCATIAGRSADPAAVIAARIVLGGVAGVVLENTSDPETLHLIIAGTARRALVPPLTKD